MKNNPGLFRSSLIALGAVTLLLLGNVNAADGNPSRRGSAPAARLGREFKLRVRQQVTLRGDTLQIRFVSVAEDSRCPADVECVWAGNAAVRLDVGQARRGSKTLTLNTTGNAPTVAYGRYEFKLVDVSPYPRSTRKIKAGDYVVTLLITKK